MLISVVMMLPLLIFGSWLYLHFTPRPHQAQAAGFSASASLGFDLLTFFVAIAGSVLASKYSLAHSPADAGPIWQPVLLTLAVYHVFAIVLPIAAWWKRKRFGPPRRGYQSKPSNPHE